MFYYIASSSTRVLSTSGGYKTLLSTVRAAREYLRRGGYEVEVTVDYSADPYPWRPVRLDCKNSKGKWTTKDLEPKRWCEKTNTYVLIKKRIKKEF